MPWVGRASGLDDPGDGLGGFGDHVAGLVLVAGGGCVGDAVADVFVEQADRDVLQRAVDCGDLLQHGGGPLCCKPVGDVSQMCEVLGGYEWGYVAGRWVWSNAAAKSRVRGWKLCHAACLQAVSRASFASTAPTLAKIGQAGWGGWLVRAAAFAAS